MKYWPFSDTFVPLLQSTGAPVDQRAAFSPELGAPITRPRTTAQVEAWNLAVIFKGYDDYAAFEAWFRDDLAQGSLPFVWRHPYRQDVVRFKFDPGSYSPSFLGAGNVRVTFSALTLPGRLFFAPYIPEGSARPPDWIADYDADRYWIGQEEVDAADLATISGSFLVLQQSLTFTQTFFTATYSGDVPQAAPATVDWLAGFAQ